MTRFDGAGHLSQVSFTTINGVAPSDDWLPSEGTYEVSSDCTGEATIESVVGPPLQLRLVIGDKGALLHTVVVGNPTGRTWNASQLSERRQPPTAERSVSREPTDPTASAAAPRIRSRGAELAGVHPFFS